MLSSQRWSVVRRLRSIQKGKAAAAVQHQRLSSTSVATERRHGSAQRHSDGDDQPSLKKGHDGDKTVMLFPGQESVSTANDVSALLENPNVRDMFDRASQILDFDLLRVCTEGPEERLAQNRFSQPAAVVSGLAAVEKLYASDPRAVETCCAAAGFSAGEIAALVFSGALTFDDGVHLAKVRSEAMQFASESEQSPPSALLAVFYGKNARLGLACEAAKKWIRRRENVEWPVCEVAQHLYQGAKVIGGHTQVRWQRSTSFPGV